MSRIVQEKFQVDYPQNRNDDAQNGWVSDRSARAKKGVPGRDEVGSSPAQNAYFYPSLPPGADIVDQEMADIRQMRMASGNLGACTDVTNDVTAESLRKGYDRKRLLATDDAYTREHNDAFYDEPVVDGETGFIERNNVLDRM